MIDLTIPTEEVIKEVYYTQVYFPDVPMAINQVMWTAYIRGLLIYDEKWDYLCDTHPTQHEAEKYRV